MLKAENLTKTFRNKTALDNVSFTLPNAGIIGLVGNNGAGKTTLINTILGYNLPTSGSMKYNIYDTFNNVAASRNMIVIDEKCGHDYLLNLERNAKRIASACTDFDIERFYTFLEEFGLPKKSYYTKLSKGMKNQFNICIGLAFNKEIYVLDEPVSGLDESARDKFYSILNSEFCRNHKQYIVSTHLFAEIQNITSEVILMRNGKCVYVGDTEALCGKYITINGTSEHVEAMLTSRKSYSKESLMNITSVLTDNNLTRLEKKYITDNNLTVTPSTANESCKVMCNYDTLLVDVETEKDQLGNIAEAN